MLTIKNEEKIYIKWNFYNVEGNVVKSKIKQLRKFHTEIWSVCCFFDVKLNFSFEKNSCSIHIAGMVQNEKVKLTK